MKIMAAIGGTELLLYAVIYFGVSGYLHYFCATIGSSGIPERLNFSETTIDMLRIRSGLEVRCVSYLIP